MEWVAMLLEYECCLQDSMIGIIKCPNICPDDNNKTQTQLSFWLDWLNSHAKGLASGITNLRSYSIHFSLYIPTQDKWNARKTYKIHEEAINKNTMSKDKIISKTRFRHDPGV